MLPPSCRGRTTTEKKKRTGGSRVLFQTLPLVPWQVELQASRLLMEKVLLPLSRMSKLL